MNIYIALSPEEKGKMTDRELKKLSRSQLLVMLLFAVLYDPKKK